jgi:mono/diheme cytochrome c family protein
MTAWSGPWGVSFTRNLTPDSDTGIGKWTEQNFIDTIRNGKAMGKGRPLLPPMPWPMYRNLTDEDLKAMYAYLKTIQPVKNRVPEPLAPEDLRAGAR